MVLTNCSVLRIVNKYVNRDLISLISSTGEKDYAVAEIAMNCLIN